MKILGFTKAIISLAVGVLLTYVLQSLIDSIEGNFLARIFVVLIVPILILIGLLQISLLLGGITSSISCIAGGSIILKILSIILFIGFLTMLAGNVYQYVEIISLI